MKFKPPDDLIQQLLFNGIKKFVKSIGSYLHQFDDFFSRKIKLIRIWNLDLTQLYQLSVSHQVLDKTLNLA